MPRGEFKGLCMRGVLTISVAAAATRTGAREKGT